MLKLLFLQSAKTAILLRSQYEHIPDQVSSATIPVIRFIASLTAVANSTAMVFPGGYAVRVNGKPFIKSQDTLGSFNEAGIANIAAGIMAGTLTPVNQSLSTRLAFNSRHATLPPH